MSSSRTSILPNSSLKCFTGGPGIPKTISVRLVVTKTGGNAARCPKQTTEEGDEEIEEVTASQCCQLLSS